MYKYFVAEVDRKSRDNSAIGDVEKTIALYDVAYKSKKKELCLFEGVRHIRSDLGAYYIFNY